jgi:pimeloyl-ACP methyl ester carboxylesterase
MTLPHDDSAAPGPPAVCLPWFGTSRVTTREAFGPALTRAPLRLIYPDLPGHGDAPALPEATSEAVLAAVVTFIEEQVQGPVLLAGASYGGYLAAAVARRRPDLVLGLLLVCPGVRRDRDLPAEPDVPADADWLDGAPAGLHDHLERAVGHRTRAVVQRILAGLEAGGPGDEEYQAALQGGDGYFLTDEDDDSAVFDRPVAVVTGRQDRIVGFADQRRRMTGYRRGTFVTADLAGHYLPYERPDLLRCVSLDWLRRCGAG